MPEPVRLNYGPPVPSLRRWVVRGLLPIIVLAALVVCWRVLPMFNRWYAMVRLRHEVLNATVRSDGPVISTTTSEKRDRWAAREWSHRPDDRLWWRADAQLRPMRPLDRSGCLLFLHERAAANGVHRLVMLDCYPIGLIHSADVWVDIHLFDPGGLLHPQLTEVPVRKVTGASVIATVPGWPVARIVCASIGWGHAFDLSPGQPDPADPSQVLFGYTLDGRRGQIIGKLISSDSVSFRTADGSPLPNSVQQSAFAQ